MFNDEAFGKLPDAVSLEKRFSFITNQNLRQNVAICFQYVIFLTIISENYDRGGAIEFSIYRDIVVHTQSVVESCIHYGITSLQKKGLIDDAKFPHEWKSSNLTKIYEISSTEQIVWGRKIKKLKGLSNNPMSKDINNTAKNIGLLDEDLHIRAEKMRELRNNIHINGENKIITYPSKSNIKEVFDDARLIIDRIESHLS